MVPGAAFYPIDQIVFRDAEFPRNAKVSRNNKVVVMGEVFAFFPFDDIVHSATAVNVSGNVNHVRSFLVSEFDSGKLSCRLSASGCINPVGPLCAPVALDAAEPVKDFLKAYGRIAVCIYADVKAVESLHTIDLVVGVPLGMDVPVQVDRAMRHSGPVCHGEVAQC